jgi:DNA-binding transcriptional MerR regulator
MPQGEVFTDIYADHGCSFAPSCLECPFEVCRYDRGFAGNRVSKAQDRVERDKKITRMRAKGMQVEHIAKACGISGRTVARILSRKGPSGADVRIVGEHDIDAEAAAQRARDRQSALDAMGVKERRPWPQMRGASQGGGATVFASAPGSH